MAQSNNPLPPLQVKKPSAILLDFVGTIAKSSFIDGTLLPYLKDNVQRYLEENWDSRAVQMDIANLRAMAEQEGSGAGGGGGGGPQISKEAADQQKIIADVVAYTGHCQAAGKRSDALTLMNFHMWFDGLNRGRLLTPIYSDVAAQLAKWAAPPLAIRVYICCNGWSQASRRFLAHTSHGDLTPYFAGYFDTEHGELTEAATYGAMIAQMQADGGGGGAGGAPPPPPESMLFLTKDVTVARAAIAAGLNAILVLTHRRSIQKLDEEGKKLPRVRSLNDIEFV